MGAGFRLRQIRERLGLTYRDVERASFELAVARGHAAFTLRISRLAVIENHHVIPSLYKLYTLATIYHLNPLEIADWYAVPFRTCFATCDSVFSTDNYPARLPTSLRVPLRFDPVGDPRRSEHLNRILENWKEFEAIIFGLNTRYLYGYIGLNDCAMQPLLRPGALVLIDADNRKIDNDDWHTEYDRPIYFLNLGDRYWCGWCYKAGATLILQPNPRSRCIPEVYRYSGVDVIGRVVGMATRLTPW